jgi:hypothetical protein
MSQADIKNCAWWIAEVQRSIERERQFRKESENLVQMYESSKDKIHSFNILYSNTETLGPAVYNSVPRPVIGQRFKDDDPVSPKAAKLGERVLSYLMDSGDVNYACFDDIMRSSVLEALVTGRGICRIKYDSRIEGDEVNYESICVDPIPWNRFTHGYGKKWESVRWVAFEHYLTASEVKENFPDAPKEMEFLGEMMRDNYGEGRDKKPHLAHVFEIWDKDSRRVLFATPSHADAFLKEVDDPLGLEGFFPCPRPISFATPIDDLIPIPLYRMYSEQAKELNSVTQRIHKIVAAMKVRGLYDATVAEIGSVLRADDNELVPVQNAAALFAQGGSLDKTIMLLPIDKLVSVLQQLYQQRQQVKQVIYEITGIADIMRGSSQASETLGAQQLKNQWGTLRLKRLQKEVARYARDILRLMLEASVNRLSQDTIFSITGLRFLTEQQKQELAMQANQIPPEQIPPELHKQLDEPTQEDLLTLLKSDKKRNYQIDIETNSTVDAEATEDKENIAELLNAVSQFLNGVAPLVQSGALPFDAANAMLLAVIRRFRFGTEIEEFLKDAKPPPQPTDPKDDPLAQQELAIKEREHELKIQELSMQAEFLVAQHQLKMEELRQKAIIAERKANADLLL